MKSDDTQNDGMPPINATNADDSHESAPTVDNKPEPNAVPHSGGGDLPPMTVRIEREPIDEKIHVAAGGKLIVPREDIASAMDVGEELDLLDVATKKIRKPHRREFIAVNPKAELPTRLLLHKPKLDGIEVQHYYVVPELRSPIRAELKEVRVFPCYSFAIANYFLWIINVTIGNNWYESLQALLSQPAPFFEQNAIRVISDKPNDRYRIRYKPMPSAVVWPTKSTEELLGESLGSDQIIRSADHPIFRDLIDGTELG